MTFTTFKPLLLLLYATILCFVMHIMLFYFLKVSTNIFHISLQFLYLGFAVASGFILSLLLFVKQKSLDNVGMVFLVLTSIKMIACYIVMRSFLPATVEKISLEKINFFVIFMMFLAIETFLTVRILNNKQ